MPFFSTVYIKTYAMLNHTVYKDISQNMHFDVVFSVFVHPCTKKWRRAQYSRRVDTAVCVRALQMCACASDVCACFRCVCVHALQMCARASDVSVCTRFRCVCVHALQMCACASDLCAENFSQRSTVTPTIPSVFYARLVPSSSPYIESWYVRLNKNASVGGNA